MFFCYCTNFPLFCLYVIYYSYLCFRELITMVKHILIYPKTMNKKQYQSPWIEVMKMQQTEIICESGVGNSSMYEEELDNSSFQEL